MRFIPGVGLFATAALVLAACASNEPGNSHSSRAPHVPPIVPWVNRPAPRYHAPAARIRPYATDAPPCRAAQLAVQRRRPAVAAGNVLERFAFRNVSPEPCVLRGFPKVTGLTANGVRRSVGARRSPDGTYFGTLVPAKIGSGGRVFLDFATGEGCEHPSRRVKRYRALTFVLPSGGAAVSAPESSLVKICGFLEMSEFGLPTPPPTQPAPRAGTPGTLRVNVTMPTAARAGRTLRFVVTLTNPTALTVRLTSCPRYGEEIFTEAGHVAQWYWLNCSTVRSIPPQSRVRYAMALRIPARTPRGLAKFRWQLGTPTEPGEVSPLTITG
jgi:hypothetical protein